MRTQKKVWKDIAKKLKNRKSISSAKGADIEESRTFDIPAEVNLIEEEREEVTSVTETDTQSYEDINKDSEDIQPICESKEAIRNASAAQEPDPSDNPSSTEIEPLFDSGPGKGNSEGEKSSKKGNSTNYS